MLLITGATGHLGSSVVQQLRRKLNPKQFIVSSSSKSGVAKLTNDGLQARLANFAEPNTLKEAFKGIDKLLLISTMDQNRYEQHKNVIDAAKEQGVQYVVYTSFAIQDINTSAVKDLMKSHFQTEDYLKSSGLQYTILRNTMYADALPQILGPNVLNQDISLPAGDGRVPYALRREMGEATANLLLQGGHEYKIYDFTGSHLYSYVDVAVELSKLKDKAIGYKEISDDVFISALQNQGFPDFAVYLHAGTIQDIKDKQYEIQSNVLAQLLGRPTAPIQEFIKELFN